jgi:hypothetical protein
LSSRVAAAVALDMPVAAALVDFAQGPDFP